MDNPTLNVIYDSRRIEKWEPLEAELKRQNISYTIWSPVEDTQNVVRSINLSHKQIIQWAKDYKLSEVAIAEDDLWFPAADGWQYFLNNKPLDFDIYIGGNYLVDNPDSWQPPLVKVREYVGNQLIIVAEKYYDKFLSVPENAHIDTIQADKGDFYVCFPYAAIQRPGFSANAQQKVNYNSNLKPEWVYGTFRDISGCR